VARLIAAVLRPAGGAPSMPWNEVRTLPGLTFAGAPRKMSNPYSDPGDDRNPKLLDGEYRSPTTRMHAVATGDDHAASRLLFLDAQRLPRGAVFDALARDGFQITPLRCGKVYTENSSAWFRITGSGKQPAVLYRAHHNGDGLASEDYAVRLDNTLPPPLPGQSAPVAGRCPGP
jgi:hypothetical protein